MAHLTNNRLCGCTSCRPIRDVRMPGDSAPCSITDPDAAAIAAAERAGAYETDTLVEIKALIWQAEPWARGGRP